MVEDTDFLMLLAGMEPVERVQSLVPGHGFETWIYHDHLESLTWTLSARSVCHQALETSLHEFAEVEKRRGRI